MDTKRSTDFFIEILKKALFFDTINIETAILLLLYLTYKELRQNAIITKLITKKICGLRYTLPIRN